MVAVDVGDGRLAGQQGDRRALLGRRRGVPLTSVRCGKALNAMPWMLAALRWGPGLGAIVSTRVAVVPKASSWKT